MKALSSIQRLPLQTVIFSLLLGLFVSFSLHKGVDAQIVCPPGQASGPAGEICADTPGSNPILSIIRTVVIIITILVGIASVIVVIVGGLQYATSGGGDGAAAARRKIVNALIGLVLSMFIGTIISFVIDRIE